MRPEHKIKAKLAQSIYPFVACIGAGLGVGRAALHSVGGWDKGPCTFNRPISIKRPAGAAPHAQSRGKRVAHASFRSEDPFQHEQTSEPHMQDCSSILRKFIFWSTLPPALAKTHYLSACLGSCCHIMTGHLGLGCALHDFFMSP